MPEGKAHTNSVGMKFVRIEAGIFNMGIDKTPLPPEIIDNISLQKILEAKRTALSPKRRF